MCNAVLRYHRNNTDRGASRGRDGFWHSTNIQPAIAMVTFRASVSPPQSVSPEDVRKTMGLTSNI